MVSVFAKLYMSIKEKGMFGHTLPCVWLSADRDYYQDYGYSVLPITVVPKGGAFVRVDYWESALQSIYIIGIF